MSASLGQQVASLIRSIRSGSEDEVATLIGRLEGKAEVVAHGQPVDRSMVTRRGGKYPRFRKPEGGRIHQLDVTVDEGRVWDEALSAVGPDTGTDWDIRKVGGEYPPVPTWPVKRRVVIVNFAPRNGGEAEALAWKQAEEERTGRKLTPLTPRGCFAVVEQHPNLYRKLKVSWMWIPSLASCILRGSRHFPYAWWHSSERGANLNTLENLRNENCWFGFVCGFANILLPPTLELRRLKFFCGKAVKSMK